MALQVRRASSIKVRLLTTLMMVLAVVAQPLYGYVSTQIASAATITDRVVINEIMAKPGADLKEWIELYNPTNSAVDLSQWRITDGSGNFTGVFPNGTLVQPNGYLVRESQNSASQLHDITKELRLESDNKNTLVDKVVYSGIVSGKSYARTYDAADTWAAQAVPTQGISNGLAPIVPPAKTPQVVTENFNTVDSTYKGVSVGFNAKDFGTVTAVTVDIARADGSHIIKTGNQGLFDLISNKTVATQVTAPIVIQEGEFTEASDVHYWKPAPAVWTKDTSPTTVTISVTDTGGTKSVVNSVFDQGGSSWPSYVSLLPVYDTVPPTIPINGAPNSVHLSINDFYFTWDLSSDTSAVRYEFQSAVSDVTDANGSLVNAWLSSRDGSEEQRALNTPTIHSTGAPDGTYYWQVRAIDAAGNMSGWSEVWSMTIDTNAPFAPNNLELKTTADGTVIPNDGFTNKSGVTATWSSNNTEQVTYVYKYWNDVEASTYKQANPWPYSLADTSYPGVVNEGEGKHYFCVVARDRAGNESACSAAYGFTYDASAPDVAIGGVNADQEVAGEVTLKGGVADKNPMNSYFIITGPNNYSQPSFYGDGRTTHEYIWKTGSLANGTYKIQFEARDRAGNKDIGSVESLQVVVNNAQPVVVSENFNTHAGDDYTGINVGFNIDNFKSVTGVSVALYDVEGNLLVTNTHNAALLDLINDAGVKQLSTPFIITPGAYTEEYWNLGAHAWGTDDKPAKAVVTVTGTNNTGSSVEKRVEHAVLSEPDDIAFEDLLPVVAAPPVVTEDDTDASPQTEAENTTADGALPSLTPIILATALPGSTTFFGNVLNAGEGVGAENAVTVAANNAAVLGAQDVKTSTPLADTAAIASASEDGSIFDLAWYWWLVIFAAAIAGWLWLAATIRRRRGAEF